MYGFGGSETQRNERSTSPTSGDDMYGANLQYNATNWGVGVGYNHNYVVPCNTSPGVPGCGPAQKHSGLEMLNVGGFIGFGPVRLYGYVKRTRPPHPAAGRHPEPSHYRFDRCPDDLTDQQLRHGYDARPGGPNPLGRLPSRH